MTPFNALPSAAIIAALRKSPAWITAAALLALVAGFAFFGTGPAQAQEPDFVDLAVSIDPEASGTQIEITVANQGKQAAYDVDVFIRQTGRGIGAADVHSISSGEYTPNGPEGNWRISKIEGYGVHTLVLVFHVFRRGDPGLKQFNAQVSSSSFESEDRMSDNRTVSWLVLEGGNLKLADAVWDLSVTMDDRNPTTGETVNFTIEVSKVGFGSDSDSFNGACVNIGLTTGLIGGTPSFTPSNRNMSYTSGGHCRDSDVYVDYSHVAVDWIFGESDFDVSGKFDVGDSSASIDEYSMTLPVTVGSGATAQQCFTAEVFALPPEGPEGIDPLDEDLNDNFAKFCWGTAPDETLAVFTSGQSDLFTWYDCSEETTGPCDSNVSLELVALGGTAAAEAGSSYGIFDPDNVVVHIPDPTGRTTSSDSNSAALVWSTGFEEPGNGHGHDDDDRPGILLGVNTEHLDLETTIDADLWGTPHSLYPTWEQAEVSVALSGRGTMSSWYHDTNDAVTAWSYWGGSLAPGGTYNTTERWLGTTEDSGFRSDVWLEFSALGTYELTMTIGTLYDDDTTDMSEGVEYMDSGTYTFHVGPIVELEVRDRGANPDLTADQHALTVEALNHGPDHAVDAEMTIDLSSLPSGVTVASHVASEGTYSNGTWDLDGLKTTDYRRSTGKLEAATLTLILAGDDAADATATATIANVADYTVCISSDGGTLAHTNQTDCAGDAATTNVWYAAVCVNTADGEIDSTITVEATCNSTTGRAWNENVCASSDGGVRTGRTETECGGWFLVSHQISACTSRRFEWEVPMLAAISSCERCSSHVREAVYHRVDRGGTRTTEPVDPGWQTRGADHIPSPHPAEDR